MCRIQNIVAAFLGGAVACAAASNAGAAVIYVNAAADPGGDGTSWKTAFDDLQDGLVAATPESGDQLWLAAGVYRPTGAGGDRAISFNLVSGAAIYGGFDGSETMLEERDPAKNVTMLSGDLNGDDVGDALDPSRAENSYHVVRGTSTQAGTVLDGLTITGGNANGRVPDEQSGGGVRLVGAVADIVNCIISANSSISAGGGVIARDGGAVQITGSRLEHNRSVKAHGNAVYTFETSISISGCEVSHNEVTSMALFSQGGAMLLWGSAIEVSDCRFEGNRSYQGGAVQLSDCTGTVDGCVFKGNNARQGGGLLSFTSVSVSNCEFIDNHAEFSGGGASAIQSSTWTNCRFVGNTGLGGGGFYTQNAATNLVNCLFSGNHAEDGGGADFRNSGSINPITMNNCTFFGNSATAQGGGVVRSATGVLNVSNCIFWGNSDSTGSGEGGQIASGVGTGSIEYCDVQGWTGSMGGTGNFGLDPLFVDADGDDDIVGTEDDNLRLSAGSPCVDRGDPSNPPAQATDIDGQPRVQACVADLGAYESSDANPLEPDCNNNGVQDSCDLAALTSTDCNFNVIPDDCDIAQGTSEDFDANGVPDECQPVPANDTCGVATLVPAGSVNFTTVNALTDGPDEPTGCDFSGGGDTQIGNDVWYRFPATCAGTVTISLCNANFDARLAVYVGCPSGPGQMIACSDNFCGQAPQVTFTNAGFTLYRIRVGGANGAIGGGTMVLSCAAAPLCPADVSPPGAPDGEVNIDDLLMIVNHWGTSNADADIDDSGVVDIDDLLAVINAWGTCN